MQAEACIVSAAYGAGDGVGVLAALWCAGCAVLAVVIVVLAVGLASSTLYCRLLD